MLPIEIPDTDLYLRDGAQPVRINFGAGQPQYQALPSVRLPGITEQVLTRWQPSDEEREAIARGAAIDLAMCTFGSPLQPVILGVAGLTYVAPEPHPARRAARRARGGDGMTTHELKCWPEQFAAIRAGDKTAEFRRDDRSPIFAVGDRLVLWEWEPSGLLRKFARWHPGLHNSGHYTGEREVVEVTHIERGFGIPVGYVMLSILLDLGAALPTGSPLLAEAFPNG